MRTGDPKQGEVVAAIDSLGGSASVLVSERKVIAVTNTAVPLGSDICKTIFVTALTTNSDVIVIGGASVIFTEATRTGKIMYPGDAITLSIDNLDSVFINGLATEGVSFSFTQ